VAGLLSMKTMSMTSKIVKSFLIGRLAKGHRAQFVDGYVIRLLLNYLFHQSSYPLYQPAGDPFHLSQTYA